MRRLFLALASLLVLALLITSCSPQAQYYICPDGRKVDDRDLCPPPAAPASAEQPKPQPVVPPAQSSGTSISEEVQKLFTNLPRVSILSFSYVEYPAGGPAVLPVRMYLISRDKMRITLLSHGTFTSKDAYDTVYLDLSAKSAVAFCEKRDTKVCPDRDKTYPVKYEDYVVRTPFEWVDMITRAELTGRSQRIESRNAIEVKFWADDFEGMMFADEYFGLPFSVTFDGKTYEFKDISINSPTLSLSDLEHQYQAE